MAAETVIRLGNIQKTYGEGNARTHVLRGVSFDVQKGELLALIGQSGSGKSTLLNIIGGLDKADSGEVEVLGVDYNAATEKRVARLRNTDIGFVFQAFNLLDHLDCLGNVTLPSQALSKSWHGTRSAGNLCYALRTRARRAYEPDDWPEHDIVCPIDLKNRRTTSFPFQRIKSWT